MNNIQTSLFDGINKFKIDKPIRLIELFGGYGSQALALKYLGVPFEHHLLSEWAVKSIQAYKDLHFAEDVMDYSKRLTQKEIIDFLDGRISADYSTPMTKEQILRKGEQWQRTVYNNMKSCNNLGSITKILGENLQIIDTDKFCYILTYSFPCQDLSSAGKGAGMARGGQTRSGLLWEVERLLKETLQLPQVLLMENVPEVIGKKNIKHFAEWVAFLDELGYKSKWKVLNATDFGIPQNRNRCFMVSILGDYFYDMPQEIELKYCLKDFLAENVDESYYLSQAAIDGLNLHRMKNEEKGNSFGWKPTTGGGNASTITTREGYRAISNFIIEQSRQESGKNDQCRVCDTGKRLQRVWKSGNECSPCPPIAYGIKIGESKKFCKPPLKDLSRTIDCQGNNGVILKNEEL